jgi:predicted transposase YbfD/YdcC
MCSHEQLDVPNCRSLIRRDTKTRRKGKVLFEETCYFINSLDPDEVSAEEFQAHILGHWEVENCLHGVKDKEHDEDKHVLGRDSWGEAWTVLTNMAVSLTNLLHQRENAARGPRNCSHAPMPTARKLGWKT